MKDLEERQIEAMCWLNDNDVEPNTELEVITGILGLIYVDEEGWDIME